MDATLVKNLLDAAFLLALSAWSGGMLLAVVVLAPALPRALDAAARNRLLAEVLPRYYSFCATCGAVTLPAYLGAPLSYPEYRHAGVGILAALLLVATLGMLYGANSLAPALLRAQRSGAPESAPLTDRLMRRQAALHAVVLTILAAVLIAHAFRPPPRTLGIREPSPQERTRLELEALQKKQAGPDRQPGSGGASRP